MLFYLQVLGICPEILVQSWLNQCFFNFLRFEEICNFLALSVLYPVECLMYYMVAIFQHLNDRICTITYSSEVKEVLEVGYKARYSTLSNFLEWELARSESVPL